MTPAEWIVSAVMKSEAKRLAVEVASLSPRQIEDAIARYVEQALRELEPSGLPVEEVTSEALVLLINEHERALRTARR